MGIGKARGHRVQHWVRELTLPHSSAVMPLARLAGTAVDQHSGQHQQCWQLVSTMVPTFSDHCKQRCFARLHGIDKAWA